jgi:hypothetical protein
MLAVTSTDDGRGGATQYSLHVKYDLLFIILDTMCPAPQDQELLELLPILQETEFATDVRQVCGNEHGGVSRRQLTAFLQTGTG